MTDIRPAHIHDAPQIAQLLNPILRDTTISFTSIEKSDDTITASIQKHQENNWPFFVADNGHVTGVASYAPFRQGPGYNRVMEHTIYVSPSHFGTGLGRRLLSVLEEYAREYGIAHLVGGISAENEAGLAFHAACGFVETGRMPGIGYKFAREIDLVLMQKRL